MQYRRLGESLLVASAMGLDCMGMSELRGASAVLGYPAELMKRTRL
jgi:hypothetical protein